jgi:uncharacterized membrane protein
MQKACGLKPPKEIETSKPYLFMTATIEISAPAGKVFDLFIDKSLFPKWKIGFISAEHLNGIPGEKGSVTRLNYKRYTMTETVIENERPGLYITAYNFIQKGKTMMEHTAAHRFKAVSVDKTLLEVNSQVTKISGFLNRIIIRLMAKAGEKQALEQLKLFKKTVEQLRE